MEKVYAGIEAGGTKFVCAVGTNPEDLQEKISIPTTDPQTTLKEVIQYLKQQEKKYKIQAIGIGSFGPIDLHKSSQLYGHITSTPKPGWANTNIVGAIKSELNLPINFDTDVNAAAFGEFKWGASKDLSNSVYITVGTGIGGGAIINKEILHGVLHPEMGHILIPKHPDDDFQGSCPFHNNCLEGLASGKAVEERWKLKAKEIDPEHKAWDLEAYYLANGIMSVICILSPQKIIIGGGISQVPGLLKKVGKQTKNLLNNYIQIPEISDDISEYIVPPKLESEAGVLGCIALAQNSRIMNKSKLITEENF
ncbi:MAG: ROK family protein [Candidatus Caenarcaniphilales bacterium]|nr:ROK family protein [Candidatus Caenarcaniphilales bacterium]